ncbi:MAG: hypothetical protein CM15mP116_11290 [Synechococcus sp.]|nr:MAG: hypothetical protein CM15mP116_11290 [Synechococcus sp.]
MAFTERLSNSTMNDQGSDPRIAQAAEAIRSADACSSAQVQAYQPPLATTSQVKSASLVIIRECCSTASRKKFR